METAARWGINTVTVVNNNSILGQCIIGIDKAYKEDTGKKEHMHTYKETNFARLAEEMGCVGIRVEDPKKLEPAIQEAIQMNKPVVIDAVTCKEASPFA
jgi:acetolactate synthase-1/2/3 large subunit